MTRLGCRARAAFPTVSLLAATAAALLMVTATSSADTRRLAAPEAHRATYRVDWRHRFLLLRREHHAAMRVMRHRVVALRRQLEQHVSRSATPTTPPATTSVGYWRAKQIAAAETIGHEATIDPWPNCPDPIFNGAASWDVTVGCENSGNWLDSPGYFRCGLQFDPMWERRFGQLCP